MAQFFTGDFADFTTCSGADCGDWTIRYRTDVTWTPASPITIPVGPSADWTALTWDDIDADADRDDVEILFKVQTDDSVTNAAGVIGIVRASGADESVTNYMVSLRTTATTGIRVSYCSASDTPTSVQFAAKTINASTDYWIRFRVNSSGPTTVKAKIWSGAIGDEPTTGGAENGWDISTTDTSGPTAAGWVGPAAYASGAANNPLLYQFGVGTNGDTAPSSAPSGAPTITALSAISITATSAQPQITYA